MSYVGRLACGALITGALCSLLVLCAACGATPQCTANSGASTRILVDLIHSRKQNPTLVLDKTAYGYTRTHGYSRLFAHLTGSGFGYDCVSEGRLTTDLLADYAVLFINLVDDTRPRFEASEIEAVEAFVEAGGGLFAITDHSNCYHSADITNPLLARFSLQATRYTAVELEPASQVEGKGWCKITRFASHPITDGVGMISFQTGGTLEATGSRAVLLATTSSNSFGDLWNENDGTQGFYGDWIQTAGEPDGPLAVAVATEHGEGRVVVVADQNIFGDMWLHYADNFRFALNAFQWLAKDAVVATEQPRHRVMVDETHNGGRAGLNFSNAGYHVFYANLNRDANVTAHATQGLEGVWDTMMLIAPRTTFSEYDLSLIDTHLAAGGNLVIILNESDSASLAQPLLDRYADGLTPLTATPGETEVPRRIMGDTGGRAVDLAPLALTAADAGERWLWFEHEGTAYDVARTFSPEGGGRVIVFCQSRFWRNEVLESTYIAPNAQQRAAWELQWVLLDALTGA